MLLIVSESEGTCHEAVSFSLSRLRLSGVSLKEEQLSAVKLSFLMEHKLGEIAILVVFPLGALIKGHMMS